MNESFEYDVFISHSSKDNPIVIDLAQRLKNDGLRVWLDQWEIKPGDLIGQRIEEGLRKSRTLVLVMSKSAFASDWVTLERQTLLFRDPTNRQRRFIPMLIEDCEIPDLIAQFAYIDWREKSKHSYEKLLSACRHDKKINARTRHVLIVDDEKMARRNLAQLLESHNYNVSLALSGKHAVTKIDKKISDIGVVLMDIKMPGEIDGIQAAIQIQNKYPDLPIILITAFSDVAEYQRRVYNTGLAVAGWIDKPIAGKNKKKLINLIEIILQKYS